MKNITVVLGISSTVVLPLVITLGELLPTQAKMMEITAKNVVINTIIFFILQYFPRMEYQNIFLLQKVCIAL